MFYVVNGIHLDGPSDFDVASAHATFESEAKPLSCGTVFGEGVTDGVAYQVACADDYQCPACRPSTEGGAFVDYLIAKHGFSADVTKGAIVFGAPVTKTLTIAETGTT